MITELPTTRAEALATGAPLYSTGKPCRHGHVAPRYATGGTCVACNADRKNKLWTSIGGAKVKLSGSTLMLAIPDGMSVQVQPLGAQPLRRSTPREETKQ